MWETVEVGVSERGGVVQREDGRKEGRKERPLSLQRLVSLMKMGEKERGREREREKIPFRTAREGERERERAEK